VRDTVVVVSEAVAIVSVTMSGLVGLGGLASTTWAAKRERLWRSREERTIDLRAALDAGSDSFATAMSVAAQIWEDLAAGRGLSTTRRAELDSAYLAVLSAGNRIGVRRGHSSSEHAAYRECIHAFFVLMGVIAEAHGSGVTPERDAAFIKANEKAVEAETEYLNQAAKLLRYAD